MFNNFYPRSLKSSWYVESVCDSIHASLQGAKAWAAAYYTNDLEKVAYLIAFEECQRLVRANDLQPKAMLQALSDYHDTVSNMLPEPFFSKARWFADLPDARDTAVRTAFQLVDNISTRYLP